VKRTTFALAGVLAVLALPIGASGAGGDSDTAAKALRGGQELKIRFTLRTRDDEPVRLARFRFNNLLVNCDDLVQVNVDGKIRSLPVNDRNRFSKTLRRPGKKVRVKGRVSNDLERVVGRIRGEGDFSGGRNCDSGWVRWRAR
jgi:hypothetical protein